METAQKSRSTSVWMTAAACLWLGLFPLLLFGSYAHITRDKWVIMLALSGLTLLCFGADGLGRRLRPARRDTLPYAIPIPGIPQRNGIMIRQGTLTGQKADTMAVR